MKTADELYLNPHQHEVLLLLLAKIEAGEIRDAPPHDERGRRLWASTRRGHPLVFFTYSTTYSDWDCGAAGCLLGWARQIGNDKLIDWSGPPNIPPELDDLFYNNFPRDGHTITIAEAGAALRNYLETGVGRSIV